MSVRLKWGHVAQLADVPDYSFSVTRLFEILTIPDNQKEVALPIPCYLALMFEADPEDGGVHDLELRFFDAKNREHSPPSGKPLIFNDIGDHRLVWAKIEIGGWILPGVGEYRFVANVNGREVGTIPISVRTERSLRAPNPPPMRPYLTVKWAHVVEGLAGSEDGTISLENILDFIPLVPNLDGIIVPSLKFCVSIEADPRVAPSHKLSVEFKSMSTGAVMRTERAFQLRGHAASWPKGVLEAFELRETLLTAGDYVFNVLVDDVPAGSFPLYVVHQALAESS